MVSKSTQHAKRTGMRSVKSARLRLPSKEYGSKRNIKLRLCETCGGALTVECKSIKVVY